MIHTPHPQPATADSFGKFILTGEHSVVYGQPAVVTSLRKKLTASVLEKSSEISVRPQYDAHILNTFSESFAVDTSRVDISVESQIPQKSGLGSSAAYASAVLQALSKYFNISFTDDELYELVFACEVFIHKKPSGIDPCAVVYGGTHSFIRDQETGALHKNKLELPNQYEFLLVNSGSAAETTGEMVSFVADQVAANPHLEKVISQMGEISTEIESQFLNGTFSGELLDANQAFLQELGVVGDRAQNIVEQLQNTGAHAKITGAGGRRTGSGWILVFSDDLSAVSALCDANGWENFKSTVQ